MKANFPACLALTLRFEGGYSNDPHDPGGATQKGVTQRTYDSYRTGVGVAHRDVREIAAVEVAELYRSLYWAKIGGDSLPSGVDMLAFDIAVNSGPGRANQWLLASAGQPPLARIYYLDAKRRSFWRALNIFARFGKGWLNREKAVFDAAVKLCTPRVSSIVSPV